MLILKIERAPILRRGMALYQLHASPAAAVASDRREWAVGYVVDITLP